VDPTFIDFNYLYSLKNLKEEDLASIIIVVDLEYFNSCYFIIIIKEEEINY
jgi:hypothetical protein